MRYPRMITELNRAAQETFGLDYQAFQPTWATDPSYVLKKLQSLHSSQWADQHQDFIRFWEGKIVEAYWCGVHNSAWRILDQKEGVINSFENNGAKERARHQKVQAYEQKFKTLVSALLKEFKV